MAFEIHKSRCAVSFCESVHGLLSMLKGPSNEVVCDTGVENAAADVGEIDVKLHVSRFETIPDKASPFRDDDD